jgi:hypothetical protein
MAQGQVSYRQAVAGMSLLVLAISVLVVRGLAGQDGLVGLVLPEPTLDRMELVPGASMCLLLSVCPTHIRLLQLSLARSR